jgi:hypothetical protein
MASDEGNQTILTDKAEPWRINPPFRTKNWLSTTTAQDPVE